jgi:hypothetical protein
MLIVAAAAVGCTGGIDAPGLHNGELPDAGVVVPPDARAMDMVDMAMLSEVAQRASFAQINAAPYVSQLGAFDVNNFVSQDARDYRRVHPETTGTNITMPVGTLIVRNVLDASGQISEITLMGKGPAGYDPTLGDWWFGVLDPQGVPMTDASGPQVGRLTDCHGCHIPRANDDFLFGVPKADQ